MSTEALPIDLDRTPGRWSFLREPQWVGLIAAMVIVSVVCGFLGRWQWNRHHERVAFADQVSAAYEAPVAPVGEVLGEPVVTGGEEWQRVALTGRYLADHQVMLRARPVNGTPAVHVLVPFLATASGGEPIDPLLLVVDRGWLPAAQGDAIVRGETTMPAPPAGRTDLAARLRVAEEPDERRGTSPGIALRIEPGQVLEAAGLDGADGADLDAANVAGDVNVLDGYAQAAEEDPAAPAGDPADPLSTEAHLRAYDRPSTGLGNNLSYAFQWWFFAVGAQVAWVLLARREADDREEEMLLGFGPGAEFDVDARGRPVVRRRAGDSLPTSARRTPRERTRDDIDEDAEVDALYG